MSVIFSKQNLPALAPGEITEFGAIRIGALFALIPGVGKAAAISTRD
jgi:hypothetical protein